MMTDFCPNDIVYLENGQAVEYLALVWDGYVVRPIYESEGEEPHWGKPLTVARIFKSAPREKYDDAIELAQARLDVLNSQIKAAQTDWRAWEAGEKERQERMKRHDELQALDDFLAGRITHVVVEHSNGVSPPSIREFNDSPFFKSAEDEREKNMKLISLFGRSGGKLDWGINRYYDGSGSWTIIYPFTSLDAAQAKMDEIWDFRMEEFRKQTGYMHGFNYWVEAAEKQGRALPADLARRWFTRELENAREYVTKGEEDVAVRRARVTVLEEKMKTNPVLTVTDTDTK